MALVWKRKTQWKMERRNSMTCAICDGTSMGKSAEVTPLCSTHRRELFGNSRDEDIPVLSKGGREEPEEINLFNITDQMIIEKGGKL
jgi:hypothetical protein